MVVPMLAMRRKKSVPVNPPGGKCGMRLFLRTHLLNVVSHRAEQDQEPQQMEAVLGAGGGVGRDAASAVVGDHDDDARAGDDAEQLDPLQRAAQQLGQPGAKAQSGRGLRQQGGFD